MTTKNQNSGDTKRLAKYGASAVVLMAAAMVALPASAQQSAKPSDQDTKEVVVVGARKALKSAQQIKRDADTVVDSITANDIGSFPDKSVAEALQRIAGITVNRFAATSDTSHFSADPSGVVVRGLQQVRSEFNGRDIFTADSSRGLSWSDVSPELMGGVDAYKNQTADLIEGGIAGSINLRTRLPFDSKGRVLALSVDDAYGDLVKGWSPSVSALYSDRWKTGLGEFGVMINVAHSETLTDSQGIQIGRIAAVNVPSVWNTSATRYLPGYVALRNNKYDRVRDGLSFATQWQSDDHKMLATFQYNQSKKTETFQEYVATANTATKTFGKPLDYVSTSPFEAACKTGTTCTFNSDGYLQSGTLVGAGVDGGNVWNGTVPQHNTGSNLICYEWDSCGAGNQLGTSFGTSTRWSDSTNDTHDSSFSFKWDPTDRLRLNFDVQYVWATQTNYDITADMNTYQNVSYDMTGDHPVIKLSAPTSVNLLPGGVTNPGNYRLNDLMDHVTNSNGHELATRLDAQYSFGTTWLDSLRVGFRLADREQTVRWSNYNWHNVVNDYTNYSSDDYFIDGAHFPSKSYGVQSFASNFYGGGVINNPSAVYFDLDLLKDRNKLGSTFNSTVYSAGGTNTWLPVCYRAGEVGGAYERYQTALTAYNAAQAANANQTAVAKPTLIPNTGNGCFQPAEVADVSEKTTAAYVMLKFGGPEAQLLGFPVSGNVGVRFVQTENQSTGGVNYSTGISYATTPTSVNQANQTVLNTTYFISAQDRAFMQANSGLQTTTKSHINWLPSFNLKLKLSDAWQLRFAASRAMSRPDIGNLKSYITVSGQPQTSNGASLCGADSVFTCNGTTPGANGQNITKTNMLYTGEAQNPLLKPVTADQFDLSAENYFASVGSFTFDLFYKKFHDYIQYGTYYRDFTNNGVTRTVQVGGPINGDGASIKGFEIAYQRYLDFLPGAWNGLGFQANYTHVVNTGVVNQNLTSVSGDGSAGVSGGGISTAATHFNNLPLEGLSKDSYNLIGMYEHGSFSARVAYNWRSQYLVTAHDCCIAFPIWQKEAGFLDASAHYRVNSNVELGLEGTNLLGTETVLYQQVSGPTDGNPNGKVLLLPNAYFKNDRRIQASIRLKY